MWQCDKSEKKTALKEIDVYKSIVVTWGITYLSGTLKKNISLITSQLSLNKFKLSWNYTFTITMV